MSALVDALYAPPPSDAAALIYDTFSAAAAGFLFDGPAAPALYDGAGIVVAPAHVQQQQQLMQEAEAGEVAATSPETPPATRVRKRRRRARSCKSREETETQRMTHIAVERNRRRQMNEYLSVLRSLMPEPYVQRGDQASIVGGAIEFVKELEQQLQCLEAQKRTLLLHHHRPSNSNPDATPIHHTTTTTKAPTACVESTTTTTTTTSNCSSSVTEDAAAAEHAPPPFAQFFAYPQYVWCHSPRDAGAAAEDGGGGRPGVADIEVTLVETHASLRVMTRRRPGQLLGLVTGLQQALRLAVLHLSVTTMDALALYSISVKVEEGCGLTTVDDIAAAVHHVLCIIDAEATEQQQMMLAS
ncbi:hypothetical protein HU200_049809 [Digitaria exilis]|uniref:BHLH domain-containing protein n=1 Tax=Digitaria exilis TaxID=1010633 RepID=A0A835E6H8_9POAL|nr:hypothetical protein HU200_049809 [Digitaria exilis]CAB3447567.1 unnamed protein product [Digitaria exilis]